MRPRVLALVGLSTTTRSPRSRGAALARPALAGAAASPFVLGWPSAATAASSAGVTACAFGAAFRVRLLACLATAISPQSEKKGALPGASPIPRYQRRQPRPPACLELEQMFLLFPRQPIDHRLHFFGPVFRRDEQHVLGVHDDEVAHPDRHRGLPRGIDVVPDAVFGDVLVGPRSG